MKKRILSLVVVVATIVLFPVIVAQAGNYGNISEETFVNKIESLKNTYVHGQYWNKYNGLEHTGYTSCPCGYSTCPGWDNCACGAFVYNDVEIAWQCHGYALKMGNEIFGGNPNNWSRIYNANSVYAGDIARLDNDGHSIFIYRVDGNDIYYTDCNAIGRCMVNWNGHMTKSTLSNRLSWLYHLDGNTLTGVSTIPPVHQDTIPHVRNGFFRFKNALSGTFMNVYGGADGNGTPITTWSFDGTIDQRFNLVHQGGGRYKIYAECSADGTNRVIDVLRNYADLAEGQSVDLYDPNDDTAQLFYIVPVGGDNYVFETAHKDGYIIAPPSAGDAGSNSRNSQLKLQRYTGADYQKWRLCNNNGKETTPNISYAAGSYKVETDGDTLNMRSGPSTHDSLVGSVWDGSILRVTDVNGNWGYTSYNGTNGWVCLDFTVYTVTADSISISKKPDKTTYFTGDSFDSTGMEISVNYSNGQKELIGSGFNISCDLSSAGTKTVNVSYNGNTTSFTVDVEDLAVNNISLYSTDIQKEYRVGESVVAEEIGILVNYNNGSQNLIKKGFNLNYDFSTPGTKTVTVSYGGKTTSYEVEVMSNGSGTTEKASFSISTESGYSGSTVTVPVKLNASNVYDGNMTIQYDASKLSIENVQTVGALSDRQVTINKEYAADKIRVSFSGTTPINSNGTILNLEFKALDNAQGVAAISIAEAKAYNKSGGAIVTDTSDGSVQITAVADNATVTNIQSVSQNGRKVVTANVSDDRVMCYLAAYQGGVLVECDSAQPSNGTFEVSVEESPNTQYKLMVWNMAMKPMINAVGIY